jgi:hypothetical protein
MTNMADIDTYLDELYGEMPAECTTFGPYTGKGSQAAARDAAGVAHPLLLQVDRTQFYSFTTEDARASFAEASQHRELIERVDGSRPDRPMLDVDERNDRAGRRLYGRRRHLAPPAGSRRSSAASGRARRPST